MLHADMFANYGAQKRCACCKKIKELFEFNRQGDGYQSYCKDCQKNYRMRHPYKEYKKNRNDNHSLDLFNEKD